MALQGTTVAQIEQAIAAMDEAEAQAHRTLNLFIMTDEHQRQFHVIRDTLADPEVSVLYKEPCDPPNMSYKKAEDTFRKLVRRRMVLSVLAAAGAR